MRWLLAGPGIFGDMGIILEIELRGERDVQRFRNSEMDMSGLCQPCVFLQPAEDCGGIGYLPGMMVSNS